MGRRGGDGRTRGVGRGAVAGAQLRAHDVEIARADRGLRQTRRRAPQLAQRGARHARELARRGREDVGHEDAHDARAQAGERQPGDEAREGAAGADRDPDLGAARAARPRAPARRARRPPRRCRAGRGPKSRRWARARAARRAASRARALRSTCAAAPGRLRPQRSSAPHAACSRSERCTSRVTGCITSTSVVARPASRARIVVASPWCVPSPPVVTSRREPRARAAPRIHSSLRGLLPP